MLLAENGNPSEVILLGFFGIFLALAFWVRTLLARRAREELSASSFDEQDDPKAADRAAARVDRFELRLHEYSRDVEARMETRLARLDRLVISADQEICRLQDLIEKTGRRKNEQEPDIVIGTKPEPQVASDGRERDPLTSWQRRMVQHLRDAGYTPREIGALLDRPETEIVAALEFEQQSQPRGAA